MTLLRTEDLTRRFGSLTALDAVDLEVAAGTVHAVIGPNGAGKTTLFNVITGLYEPSEGRVCFRDDEITGEPPHVIARRGIARSFQESDVYLGLTVGENVRIAAQASDEMRRSLRSRASSLESVTERGRAILGDIGLASLADEQARNLSHGDRRKLEIALTVVDEPDLLLLDEPTAGMDKQDSLDTVEMIERLATERGITIVMIEHDIEIVMSISDTISVLQNGVLIAEGPPSRVKRDESVRDAYLGSRAEHSPTDDRSVGGHAGGTRESSISNRSLLALDAVYAAYGQSSVLRGVTLDVGVGETVSLIGRNGVGKTTTLRTIAGVLTTTAGSLQFDGEDISSVPDFERMQRGVSYVPEDRQIFPELTVAENLRMGEIGGAEHRFTVAEVYDLFPRLRDRRDYQGQQLSGGEQQMLAIARALVGPTELLLLDEPTEGLAPQIIADVIDIIEDIRDAGVTVLLVEQNLHAATSVADRHYVLHQGEIAYEGTTPELRDATEIIDRYLGVGATVDSEG
jgi:ABC-type branched-subunit amino acid transport system ATPase component